MNFMSVFIKMMELFLIILIGYGATKLGVLNATIKEGLSKIILNISMPCTILASVMMTDRLPDAKQILGVLLVAFLTYVVLYLLAKITSFLLRLSGQQKAVAEFGIIFANVGFIGFPVTQAVFGNQATFYTSVFNMPFNLLCYSLGVYLIQKGNGQTEALTAQSKETEALTGRSAQKKAGKENRIKSLPKLFGNAGLIAAVICLIMALCKYRGPRILGETFEIIGGITTPGALLIIGAALAQMPVKEMFGSFKAYIITFISVVVTPLAMYVLFAPFVSGDALLLGETVVISAMPVATAGTMLCVAYGGDETFMAQITFLSTLLSVITIPLIATLL